MPQYHDDPDDPDDPDDFDDFDGADDLDDLYSPDEPNDSDDSDDSDDLDAFDADAPGDTDHAWRGLGSPPVGYPSPPPGWRPTGGHAARRGLLLALTAIVAAGAGFGVVTVALGDASGTPAASATPSSATPSAGGAGPSAGGTTPSSGTQTGGAPSLPPGASEQLEIGGSVTAVSATSITLDGGGQSVTAAVNPSTRITGKVTGIGGIKVGDLVSALITGANGKLTADSIQDPASLPAAPGQ